MPGSTLNLGLPYPLGNETADPALDIKNLAESLDGKVETQTGAQEKIDALAGAGNTETVKGIADDLIAHKADFTQQIPYAVTTGSANTYTVSTNPALTSLIAGVAITVKIHTANTGASTLNWDGKGAIPIKKSNGNDVASGNLKLNGVYTFRYDGTNFILQGEGGEYGTAGQAQVLTGYTFGTEEGIKSGTMPNKVGSGTTLSVSASDQAIPQGYYDGTVTSGKVAKLTLTAGNSAVYTGHGNYIASIFALTKMVDVSVNMSGTLRVSFQMASRGSYNTYGQIYVNGVARGAYRTTSSTSNTTFTEDISINAGDHVQLYMDCAFYADNNIGYGSFNLSAQFPVFVASGS